MSVHEVPKIPALSILCLTYPALAGAGLLQASPNAISPSWLASLAHRNFAQCNLRHPVSSPIGGSVSPDVVSKWRLQPLRIISFSCSSSPTPPFCRFGEIQKLRSRLYHPCSSPRACQKNPETFDHDNLRHQHQQHRPFGFRSNQHNQTIIQSIHGTVCPAAKEIRFATVPMVQPITLQRIASQTFGKSPFQATGTLLSQALLEICVVIALIIPKVYSWAGPAQRAVLNFTNFTMG